MHYLVYLTPIQWTGAVVWCDVLHCNALFGVPGGAPHTLVFLTLVYHPLLGPSLHQRLHPEGKTGAAPDLAHQCVVQPQFKTGATAMTMVHWYTRLVPADEKLKLVLQH